MSPGRDPFDELRSALDVGPSLGFAAGVRARLAAAGHRRRTRAWFAATTVAVVVLAAVIWPRTTSEPLVPAVETTLGSAEVATYRARFAAPDQPAPADAGSRSPAQPRAAGAIPAPLAEFPRAGRLDVVTDQGDILRRLWAAKSPSDVAAPDGVAAAPAAIDALPAVPSTLVVPRLVVEPIVVIDVFAGIGGGARLPAPPPFVARDATRSHQ